MKPIDAIRLQLKAMELVEGTELEWWDAIKVNGMTCSFPLGLRDLTTKYELEHGILGEEKIGCKE